MFCSRLNCNLLVVSFSLTLFSGCFCGYLLFHCGAVLFTQLWIDMYASMHLFLKDLFSDLLVYSFIPVPRADPFSNVVFFYLEGILLFSCYIIQGTLCHVSWEFVLVKLLPVYKAYTTYSYLLHLFLLLLISRARFLVELIYAKLRAVLQTYSSLD